MQVHNKVGQILVSYCKLTLYNLPEEPLFEDSKATNKDGAVHNVKILHVNKYIYNTTYKISSTIFISPSANYNS
jgi:hypothetical protein